MRREDHSFIGREVSKLRQKIRGVVTRAKVVASLVTGRGQIMTVGLLQGQTRSDAEYFEPYGLAAAVPQGSEGVALRVGGSADHIIVVCASPKGGTPKGRLPGEVDVYSQFGARIRFHVSGDISLLPGGTGVVYTGSGVNPSLPNAAGTGDSIVPSPEAVAWMAAVTALLNVPPGTLPVPPPASMGTIAQAPNRKTKVG